MKDLRSYIVVIKDAMPHSVCDAILAEYGESSEWGDTYTKAGLDKKIRSASTILISTEQTISLNSEIRLSLDKNVFESASLAIAKYREAFEWVGGERDTGYELLRYRRGEFYTEHVDEFTDMQRQVSCSFSLNDDYQGGEFAFFKNDLKIRAPKGSAIMFPSNFMYPHQILPVTEGVRYSIITWFV